MGVTHSSPLKSNPNEFATRVNSGADDDASKWRGYDYVIVGGGTAGCVLASRLSENRDKTVLLIEAGGSHKGHLMSSIPFAFSKTFHTSIDWAYKTTPQKHMKGQEIDWFRGKILGGTSAINAAIYHHCDPQDFEQWGSMGLSEWNYKSLRPYFTKAEKYNPSPKFPGVKPEDRGSSGPWITGHSADPLAPVCQAAYQAFKTIVPEVSDINTPRGTAGVVEFIGNIDPNGRRVTTATAYLTPDVLARPNLTVAINMHVDKIVTKNVEGQGLRAVGVVISTSPTSPIYGVCAKTEVILSAGAVGTPQLLLLSGVGPAAELEKLDIKVVHDSPAVGKNLSDHIGAGSLRFRAKPGYTWDYLRGTLSGANSLLRFLLLSKGPFTTLCVPGAAFVRSDNPDLPFSSLASPGLPVKDNSSGPGVPDIEVLWAPATVVGPGLQDPPAGSIGLTMLAINLRPESTGTITLKSKNSWDAPIIEANYFASETDLNVVVRAVRLAQRLARIEPLASMLDLRPESADRKSIWWVGDVDPDAATDEDMKDFIRGNALPEYHPISTARMGLDPKDSVVDAELRVHGIKNLRVVDASVFPTQVTGHPCSVIIAIAEKASDMIKNTAT